MAKKQQKLKTITISRKRWYRGKGTMGSRLYRRSDRTMCCLGFASRQCGASVKMIENVALPSSVILDSYIGLDEFYKYLLDDIHVMSAMAGVNDDPDIIDAVRERRLKQLAKQAGMRFVFTD